MKKSYSTVTTLGQKFKVTCRKKRSVERKRGRGEGREDPRVCVREREKKIDRERDIRKNKCKSRLTDQLIKRQLCKCFCTRKQAYTHTHKKTSWIIKGVIEK